MPRFNDVVEYKPLLTALVTGLFPVVVLALDGFWSVPLVAFIWFSWTLVGWFFTTARVTVRDARARWVGLHVLVVSGGTFYGINMSLPIAEELTTALWFLVFGIGWATMFIGMRIGVEGDVKHPESSVVSAD